MSRNTGAVSASDCDSEENAEYYTLSPDFTISSQGTIFPAGPLDYERPNQCERGPTRLIRLCSSPPPRLQGVEYILNFTVTDNNTWGSAGAVLHSPSHRRCRQGHGFMQAVPAFSIHPDTGVIVTARKFDRERQREYAVTVTATDQATDPLIGICQLNILILDQNDNSPKFENLRYKCEL
ncbi:hypothetical protein NHX12_006227, partial [Muraenolepis orangiensis]